MLSFIWGRKLCTLCWTGDLYGEMQRKYQQISLWLLVLISVSLMHLNSQRTCATILDIEAMNKKGVVFITFSAHCSGKNILWSEIYNQQCLQWNVKFYNFICIIISRTSRNKSGEPLGIPNTPDSSVIIHVFCCLDEEISLRISSEAILVMFVQLDV